MPRTKDIKKSFLRYAVVVTSLFVLFLFFERDNLFRWIQAGFTVHRQEHQIELLEKENRELDRKIEALSSNRDSLETYAREEFFFTAPGEDVYIVE